MYIYICMYVYIYINTQTHTYMYIDTPALDVPPRIRVARTERSAALIAARSGFQQGFVRYSKGFPSVVRDFFL